MNGWETEGPYEWDGLGRDVCYAWTKRGSRCGMPGTAWPHGVLGSDVYLCGIHGRRMEETVRHSVQEGHLKLRLPEPVAPLEHKEHTLYKYYNAQGEPLYFKTRDRVHSEKAWYANVDRCDLELAPLRLRLTSRPMPLPTPMPGVGQGTNSRSGGAELTRWALQTTILRSPAGLGHTSQRRDVTA